MIVHHLAGGVRIVGFRGRDVENAVGSRDCRRGNKVVVVGYPM